MSRYIEVEKAMELCDAFYFTEETCSVERLFNDTPSIDIVRCKECEWFRKAPNTEHDYDNSCGVWASICEEDGFCNYGERREP